MSKKIIDIFKNLNKFIRIFSIEILLNKGTIISEIIGGLTLPIIIQLLTWKFVFSKTETINNYTFNQMAINIFITVLFLVISDGFSVIEEMSRRIKNGSIEVFRLKPMSYFNLTLYTYIGRNIPFILATIIILVIFTIIYTKIHFIIPIITIFLVAQFISFQISYIFSLFSYWFINHYLINYFYYLSLQIFGGILIPINLWPEPYQSILKYNPFRIVISGVTDILLNPSAKSIFYFLILSFFYYVIFMFLIHFIENLTIKKYHSYGG